MFQVVGALPTENTEQFINQTIIRSCKAQLKQRLLQQQMLQAQSQQPQPQAQPNNTIISTQDWTFSQSQPPQGHSMFPQTQSQEYTKVGTKSSSMSNLSLPNPVYHPSISSKPAPPQQNAGACNLPEPVYHATIKTPYAPTSREIQLESINPGCLM